MLVPDRWIFLVKAACRAFSYGRERACRFKSNIPRKIPLYFGRMLLVLPSRELSVIK